MARGRFWDDDEIAAMLGHMAKGVLSAAKMAEIMNRSAGSCFRMMRLYGDRYLPPKMDYSRKTTPRHYNTKGRTENLPTYGYGDVEQRQPYNPLTDEKPVWLKRGRA